MQARPVAPTNSVNIEQSNYYQSEKDRYQDIITHINTCCLCGSDLKFHYQTDYILRTVREEAHCNSCGIRTKKDSFTIQ